MRRATVAAADAGMRLDNYLLRELAGVPRSHVYRIIRSGEVRINGGRCKAHTRVASGDLLRLPPLRVSPRSAPTPSADAVATASAAILAEGEDWLLANKPAGMPVHAGSGISAGFIEALRQARPGETVELAHRLDRDTSGCLLIARNRAALNAYQDAWRQRRVEKTYLALLVGAWQGAPEREVDAPLSRDQVVGGERMAMVDAAGKVAHSRFVLRTAFAQTSLVEVQITTGRTHQIRVHAAHLGQPVAGDSKYGERTANKRLRALGLRRMFLHAWRLRLPGAGDWEAPLPPALQDLLSRLELAA